MSGDLTGVTHGAGLKFAVVVARFNEFITENLLLGTKTGLTTSGVSENDIDVVWVPGSFELPLTAKRLAETRKYAAIICLGAVIRGDTPHFEYVSSGTAHGLIQASLLTDVPIIFGVLTTETVAQAMERSMKPADGTTSSNKGHDAAFTAIEIATLLNTIEEL